MSTSTTLIKTNPLLPAEDFVSMRRQGIKSIERQSHAIWTEYNNSDPGITILEAVCYAITDLSYRTGFEVKDLLAPENLTDDTWKNIFYTARQILHNAPLTINDYRKLIIDVKGVRNAWIEPSKDYEVPVWVDYNFYDYMHEHDCDCACECCEDKACRGKLGVEPISKEQVSEFKNTALEYIKEQAEKLNTDIEKLKTVGIELQTRLENETEEHVIEELREKLNETEAEIKKIKPKLEKLDLDRTNIERQNPIDPKIVEFEGLYNVMVEYEEDVLEEEQRDEVRQHVIDALWTNRNLCEDILSVNAVEYEDFGIQASFVLEEYADPDAVLAQVYFTIYKYFSPSIPFHTIQQMLDKGHTIDEIFEGPALTHGFVDDEELEKTDLFRDIHLSDLINEIADIEGMKAITYFHLPVEGMSSQYFNKWVNYLKDERKMARIMPSMSMVACCKERDFISYNLGREEDRHPRRMLKLFKDLKIQERTFKLVDHQIDFPVPNGTHMDLEDYYPVTYSLPICYGVNDQAGLPLNADEKRKTQAKQLSGYLLFYEQIIADHLVQLNHLKSLFSFDDDIEHTYFTKTLRELENLKELLLEESMPEFSKILMNLMESTQLFEKRRNRFLNHMLARFDEDMSEYEALSRWLTPDGVDRRLLDDKIRALKDGEYIHISNHRGKGINYTNAEFWNTTNVSGAERRVSRLLGFKDARRKTLAPRYLVIEPLMEVNKKTNISTRKVNYKGDPLNIIKLYDPDDDSKVLLTSVEVKEGCCTEVLINEILKYADDQKYYMFRNELKARRRKSAKVKGSFWYELYDDTDPEKAVLLATGEIFDSERERDDAFARLQEIIKMIHENEGLHLVEHILLRPEIDEVFDENNEATNIELLDICLDTCDLGIGLDEGTEVPPYKKKITRIPAEKCYDKMPWILEYIREKSDTIGSILFEETYADGADHKPLKFRRYERMTARVSDLHEYGSERINYRIVNNQEEGLDEIKYSFIIEGDEGKRLAQSPYVFNKKTKAQEEKNIEIEDDIEVEIALFMKYFGFEFDLYCEPNPCDHNEDPYSFRTTIVLPCWPKRFRDPTFRNFVEKKIYSESPAHIHSEIFWLGLSEMKEFEGVYCDWLEEMSQTEMPSYEKVNPLVRCLNELCPCETCDDECK